MSPFPTLFDGCAQLAKKAHRLPSSQAKPSRFCISACFFQLLGVALPGVTKAPVSGEAFAPSLQDWMAGWLAERSAAGYQSCVSTDLRLIACEPKACEGLVLDEGEIVKIVQAGPCGSDRQGLRHVHAPRADRIDCKTFFRNGEGAAGGGEP